jgi:protein CpxP
MKSNYKLVAGIVAGVALAVATATYAQPFGGMGPGMGMGPGHGPMGTVDPSTMVESHLSDLKAQLKITPAQEAAWQAFTAQAKQQTASMQTMRAQMLEGTGTAPERMAQRTTAMQQRAAGMATMTTAFSTLYAVLTPEQKAIADQTFGMMGHGGMRFGPRAG